MVDHRRARARQRVVVEHDLVALSVTVGEAPRSRNFAGEDGDHGYYAAQPCPGRATFIVGGLNCLRSGPQETVVTSLSALWAADLLSAVCVKAGYMRRRWPYPATTKRALSRSKSRRSASAPGCFSLVP